MSSRSEILFLNEHKIGVLGLGYVGLPLALLFSTKYKVYGYDPNHNTINRILSDEDIVNGVEISTIKTHLNTSFYPSSDISDLKECDVYIICVPTPLRSNKKPDLSYIKKAAESIVPFININKLVILESTTYPGTTEGLLSSILEKSGYKAGDDFYVAFSPERIDPGNGQPLCSIPKVIGGINDESTKLCSNIYRKVFDEIVVVSDAKTAEATKLFENIFRLVNIALVNEISLVLDQLNISTWDVISAASTKPYGFMPFYPGPGVGGHCIPLDPFYLTYSSERLGISSQFIHLSTQINDYMMMYVINLIELSLKQFNVDLSKSTIALFGLTYKKDVEDIRESPSKHIINELDEFGVNIRVHDPFVKETIVNGTIIKCYDTVCDALEGVDCAVFLVDHSKYALLEPNEIVNKMKHKIIIDCKNIFGDKRVDNEIHLTGIGKNIK
jgi:UDP-N-acetyl-D-glucosamine dehydrogenase